MSTLKELVSQELKLVQRLYASDGEITPEMEQELAITESMLEAKVDNYYLFMERVEAEIERWDAHIKSLSKGLSSFKKTKDWLSLNLKNGMIRLNESKLKGAVHEFSLSGNRFKLVIEDVDKIPGKFLVEVVRYEPDKEAIKDALEKGESVPGAYLDEVFTLRKKTRKDV